jgi:hypothetical protein
VTIAFVFLNRERRKSRLSACPPAPKLWLKRAAFAASTRPMTGQFVDVDIIFDNVRVPATNLIGEEGEGFRIAVDRISVNRLLRSPRASSTEACRRAGLCVDPGPRATSCISRSITFLAAMPSR